MEHTPQQPESDETNEVDKIVDEPEVVALRVGPQPLFPWLSLSLTLCFHIALLCPSF